MHIEQEQYGLSNLILEEGASPKVHSFQVTFLSGRGSFQIFNPLQNFVVVV